MAWGSHIDPSLYYAHCITTFLSLCGSIFMSYFCLKTGSAHSPSGKLILSIALSDFLYSTANILAAFEGETISTLCLAEGFLRVFSLELCLLFPTCVAILCYKATQPEQNFDHNSFVKKVIVYGVFGCLCLASGPLLLKEIYYKNYDTMCFTAFAPDSSLALKVVLFLAYAGIPVIAALITTITGYLVVIKRISKLPQGFIDETGISVYKLLWYPAVLFFTYTPNILLDIAKTFFKKEIAAIKVISLVITHSLGFTNALVYGIQRKLYYGKNQDYEEVDEIEKPLERSDTCVSFNEELLMASRA